MLFLERQSHEERAGEKKGKVLCISLWQLGSSLFSRIDCLISERRRLAVVALVRRAISPLANAIDADQGKK